MITPEQMLQEAIEKINSLSIDELEAMFREAGFNPVRKKTENFASLPNKTTKVGWINPATPILLLNRNFAINNESLDIAA